MIIWLRNIIFIFLILSAIYALLSISGRYKARKRLESKYNAEGSSAESKQDYLAKGLTVYDRSMRPKLFLFVFILPILIIATLIYLAQHS